MAQEVRGKHVTRTNSNQSKAWLGAGPGHQVLRIPLVLTPRGLPRRQKRSTPGPPGSVPHAGQGLAHRGRSVTPRGGRSAAAVAPHSRA